MQVKATGTQAATISTEHTLLDTSDPGTYALITYLANLVAGDTVELRIYAKAITGGAYQVAFRQPYVNAQDRGFAQSFHVFAPFGAKFTLLQSAGTGRSYGWSVVQLDA